MLPSYLPPPPPAVIHSIELPLLPGSDPQVLAAYRWAVAHSPSLREVVRRLALSDRKASYRLLPGFSTFILQVAPRGNGYEVEVEVPILAWTHCGDALEAWVASALFIALEVIDREQYRAAPRQIRLAILDASVRSAFPFQRQVKRELQAADPERLKDLPDGWTLYQSHFTPPHSERPARRPLPPSAAPQPPAAEDPPPPGSRL